MACDEQRIVGYLAGGLSEEDVLSFEEHLLACDECWTAVTEDRRGREAAERLSTLAPPELRDRVRAAVSLQPGGRRRRWRRVGLMTSGAFVALLLAGTGLFQAKREADAPVVSAVLRLAATSQASSGVRDLGGRRVEVSTYRLDGARVILARSATPFPMPAHAMPLGPHGGEPWMARRGRTSVLCLNRPEHVLMAGRVSPARLLSFARGLGLTP